MSKLRLLNFLALGALFLAVGCTAPGEPPVAHFDPSPPIGAGAFRAEDGTALPVRSWLPSGKPRAVVLALHGFGDYSAAFRGPGAFWASEGIATYAFDQRGFGGAPHTFHWSGSAAMAADAKSAARALRRLYPHVPLYLLGESMGGAVALAATTGDDPADLDGMILVSPATWEHGLVGTIERSALSLTGLMMPGLWLEAPRGLNIRPSDNIEMLRGLWRDSLVQKGARADTTAGLMDLMDRAAGDASRIRLPTLVLFGAHEEVLPEAAVSSFLARLPADSVRVALYPEGYHMLLRDLHAELVWKDVLAWMLDHTAPLPSGDECAGLAARTAACRKTAS